jgi:hypothetical protein
VPAIRAGDGLPKETVKTFLGSAIARAAVKGFQGKNWPIR